MYSINMIILHPSGCGMCHFLWFVKCKCNEHFSDWKKVYLISMHHKKGNMGVSNVIHQAIEEWIIIIVLHCFTCFVPHNYNYRGLIIKLHILISFNDTIARYTSDMYMQVACYTAIALQAILISFFNVILVERLKFSISKQIIFSLCLINLYYYLICYNAWGVLLCGMPFSV